MSHVTDKLAEFVWEELSTSEMAEGRRHLAECSGCREQVEQFQHTHAMLRSSPDVEPPRRMVFEVEKPRVMPWIWRWVGPMAASAAVALAIVSLAPAPQPQIIERVAQQQPASPPAVQAAAQPVDYEKIVTELRAEIQAEIQKRDVAQNREMQRVWGELDVLDSRQRAARRDNVEMAAAIQPLLPSQGAR